VVICLEQGADLHMAQLMPLPLSAKSRLVLPFGCVCVCILFYFYFILFLFCLQFFAADGWATQRASGL